MQGSRNTLISAITDRNRQAVRASLLGFELNKAKLKWYKLKLRAQTHSEKKLVQQGLDHALTNQDYESAFILSAFIKPKQALDLVKSKQFEVDPGSIEASKAILYAISQGDTGAVKALLKQGVDPNLSDEQGSSLLHKAVLTKNVELVKTLLYIKSGININAQDAQGNTAFMLAIAQGSAELLNFLVQNEVDLSLSNHKGQTAVDIAQNKGLIPLAKSIQRQINTKLLDQAVRNNDVEAAGKLLSQPVQIDKLNSYNMTALMEAAKRGNLEMVKLLHEAGAKINFMYRNNNALMLATVGNHRDVMRYLLDNGALVNDRTDQGNTAILRAASMRCEMETIKLLRYYGADFHVKNNKSQSIADIAKEAGHSDLVDYINKAPKCPPSPVLTVDVKQPLVHFSMTPRRLEFNPMSPAHKSPSSLVLAKLALSPRQQKCRTPHARRVREL
ncbi:MAG: ankyrin repeat-containing protein [Gammaproteobacteria bacterium]|nr:ankyrin repeat-containing protein [Gammaproteobacteria bacterium]